MSNPRTPAMGTSAFLSVSDRETLDENVPRSYLKLAFTSSEAVDGTALARE